MTHFIAIGIGSNTPNAQRHVDEACRWLAGTFTGVRCSESYLTDGVGDRCRGMKYRNAVAVGHTGLTAEDVCRQLKEYEVTHGRDRGVSEVPIDLDLVVYDDEVLRHSDFDRMYFLKGYRALIP